MTKTCEVDDKIIFNSAEEPYTVECEACQHHCKIYHYRACEARHEWNRAQGIDVFQTVYEQDRMARSQLQGTGSNLTPLVRNSNQNVNSKKKTSRHRGR